MRFIISGEKPTYYAGKCEMMGSLSWINHPELVMATEMVVLVRWKWDHISIPLSYKCTLYSLFIHKVRWIFKIWSLDDENKFIVHLYHSRFGNIDHFPPFQLSTEIGMLLYKYELAWIDDWRMQWSLCDWRLYILILQMHIPHHVRWDYTQRLCLWDKSSSISASLINRGLLVDSLSVLS